MKECKGLKRNLFCLLVLGVSCTCLRAGIISVGQGTGYDYGTIQAGLSAAGNGDTVIVAGGTYFGDGNINLNFSGKAVHLKSEDGPTGCIIDCQNNGRGFYIGSGERAGTIVDGFTITNGNNRTGGGMRIIDSSPTITNCIFRNNYSPDTNGVSGAGIFCGRSSPSITNCIFDRNIAQGDGGGIFNHTSSPSIINCTFAGNEADGGPGMFNYVNSMVTMKNCIHWNNDAESNYDIINQSNSVINITACDIEKVIRNLGGSSTIDNGLNIRLDPLFVDFDNSNYHLLGNSPCIDAGIDAGVYVDIEGNFRPYDFPGIDNNGPQIPDFDIGAYEVPEPFTLSLLAVGGLIMIRRKHNSI